MSKPYPSQTTLLLMLPSHITVLFVAIVGVVWVVLASGIGSGAGGYAVLMLLLSIVLPLRHLLTWVDRTCVRLGCRPDLALQPVVDEIARDLGLKPAPRIQRAARPIGIHAIGGLRRHVIVAGGDTLDHLQRGLLISGSLEALKARAVLMHEMQHFLRYDTRYLEWTRCLLLACAKWAGWVILMSLSWYVTLGMFLRLAVELVVSPGFSLRAAQGNADLASMIDKVFATALPPRIEIAKMLSKIDDLNFSLAMLGSLFSMLPFIISGMLLWRFVYYRMLHVREHYADLGAASRSSPEIVAQAILDADDQNALSTAAVSIWQHMKWLPKQIRFGFSYHPSSNERRWVLRNPVEALTDPIKNGNTIGFILLCLYIVLTSGFSVATVGSGPWHFGVLLGFVAISVMMTPATITYSFKHTWQLTLICIRRVSGIGFSWIIINILLGLLLLLISPEYLFKLLEATAKGTSGIIGSVNLINSEVIAGVWHTVWGTLITLPLAVVALCAGLWLDLRIKHIMLPNNLYSAKRLNWLCWGITLTISSGLFLGLTTVTALIMLDPSQIYADWFLLLLSLLGCIGGSLCLFIIHQSSPKGQL